MRILCFFLALSLLFSCIGVQEEAVEAEAEAEATEEAAE